MKKLLIINQSQFGYHLDTYYYCKYLKDDFDITYICWDYVKKRIEMNKIDVKYVSRDGNLVIRNIRFIINVIKEIKNNKYNIHFIKYFRGCSVLKILFPLKNFIFDIRTSSPNKSKFRRSIYDKFMKFESKFYKNITIITESLRNKLKIYKNKTFILPLGADVISNKKREFNEMNLIYVGILSNRNIEETIIGFEKFYKQNKQQTNMKYTIIGDGYYNEIEELKMLVKEKGLDNVVEITGYVHHNDLEKYFDTHNIGISYVPKTEFFDVQPPTKTFEYLLSGMPVVATNTLENVKVINSKNGVLIDDNSEGFYKGLIELNKSRKKYNSSTITKSVEQYKWESIVNNFKKYLEKI
ncbi:MAG: glycosyltransferase [Candidatus Marinimicrobia bacterium]|nr:glycosyltransferase [Candidatus Neomarinimicrobiota bacterium]